MRHYDSNGILVVDNLGGGGGGGGIALSAGSQLATSGTVVFSNSNGVTFGMSGSTRVTASVASSLTNINLSAGTTSNNLSAVVFSNSNNVTFGLNGSTVTASASAASSLTNINVSAGTTSNNLSAVVFSNSNRVSFGLNGSTVTAQHALNFSGGTTSQNISDQIVFSNLNNFSFGLNGSTMTGSYTVPSTAGLISAVNFSAGTTSSNLSQLKFSDSNGVSFGLQTGSVLTASVSQSNQAASASNGSFAFQTIAFSNANNVTFGTSAGSIVTASVVAAPAAQTGISSIAASNTTYTSGGVTFTGSNIVTVRSTTGQGIVIDASTSQSNQQVTAYARSNTTQSSSGTYNASSVQFAGAGIASVGITNGSVVISVPAGGGGGDGGVFAGVSNLGNTAGSTGTVSTGNFVLVGTNGISLSQSTGGAGSHATVTILGPNPESRFVNEPSLTQVGTVMGNSLVSIFPVVVPFQLDMSNLRFGVSVSGATTTNTSSAFLDVSCSAVLYTLNGSTLSSINSASNSYVATWNTNSTASVNGARGLTMDWASSTRLERGGYWIALHMSTQNTSTGGGTASTALGNTISMLVGVTAASAALGLDPFFSATAASRGASIGLGILSTGATRGTIAISDITQTGTRAMCAKLWVDLRNFSLW